MKYLWFVSFFSKYCLLSFNDNMMSDVILYMKMYIKLLQQVMHFFYIWVDSFFATHKSLQNARI